MKTLYVAALGIVVSIMLPSIAGLGTLAIALGGENESLSKPDQEAIERSHKTVQMLDNIYKQTIVLITDKYVHDVDDFPAGSAAVALFANVSKSGSHKVRLIDATGEPYDPENVARDDFERSGIKQLKAGAEIYEQVVLQEGKHHLRALTPIPVVMKKCVMCHDHYAEAGENEPIGAISYRVPID